MPRSGSVLSSVSLNVHAGSIRHMHAFGNSVSSYGTQIVCKFVCMGGTEPISGTRAAFVGVKTGIFTRTAPI